MLAHYDVVVRYAELQTRSLKKASINLVSNLIGETEQGKHFVCVCCTRLVVDLESRQFIYVLDC